MSNVDPMSVVVVHLGRFRAGKIPNEVRQVSRSSHFNSDFSRSIDENENGPGAFWKKATNATGNADDQSSSTISEVNAKSQQVIEGDIEEGRDEHSDVKRIKAQNEAAGILSPGMTINPASTNIRKRFSFEPPSSSITTADMTFLPDPPLKDCSANVQKECVQVQSHREGQPVKERY